MIFCRTLLQGQPTYDNFYHLSCRLCEKSFLPSIWKEHSEKLSDGMSTKIWYEYIAEWDKLVLSWNNIDILDCFLPKKGDRTVAINARRFLLRPAEHYNQCHQPAEAVKVSSILLCPVLITFFSVIAIFLNNYCVHNLDK